VLDQTRNTARIVLATSTTVAATAKPIQPRSGSPAPSVSVNDERSREVDETAAEREQHQLRAAAEPPSDRAHPAPCSRSDFGTHETSLPGATVARIRDDR
jgi:hypothetical protein